MCQYIMTARNRHTQCFGMAVLRCQCGNMYYYFHNGRTDGVNDGVNKWNNNEEYVSNQLNDLPLCQTRITKLIKLMSLCNYLISTIFNIWPTMCIVTSVKFGRNVPLLFISMKRRKNWGTRPILFNIKHNNSYVSNKNSKVVIKPHIWP